MNYLEVPKLFQCLPFKVSLAGLHVGRMTLCEPLPLKKLLRPELKTSKTRMRVLQYALLSNLSASCD